MGDIAIKVEGLSKRYVLNHQRASGDGLRHILQEKLTSPFRGFSKKEQVSSNPGVSNSEEFWALKDVSFDIKQGDVVGIIGRNGAGKSTLLKILSRITEPTSGRISIEGRVASLLEVGTGFHPELTGRENIFLNGAILGMKRVEIQSKFDEIVGFAEIDRFLDTPVKRYSSGMYVRLAFAVSAHLETDILIVDEVLAVGDVQFQKKCLGKMQDVSTRGRTVLFVSHNMEAIQRLCKTCKLLENGSMRLEGPSTDVLRKYLELSSTAAKQATFGAKGAQYEIKIRVFDATGKPTRIWRYDESLEIRVCINARVPIDEPVVDITFYDARRIRLIALEGAKFINCPRSVSGEWDAIFVIENPGLTLEEIIIDVGVRTRGGVYFALLENAAMLSSDFSSVPQQASAGTLLFPHVTHRWEPTAKPRSNQ